MKDDLITPAVLFIGFLVFLWFAFGYGYGSAVADYRFDHAYFEKKINKEFKQ